MKFFAKKTDKNDSDNPEVHDNEPENGEKKFTVKRIIIVILLAVLILWVIVAVIGFFMPSASKKAGDTELAEINSKGNDISSTTEGVKKSITDTLEPSERILDQPPGVLPDLRREDEITKPETVPPSKAPQPSVDTSPTAGDRPVGIAVTEAIIEPLEYELRGRFWGWRVNDLIQITDNVQNYQLGVLEVTRRAVVALAERMSRTGSTASYVTHLEDAMNWIMVKADAYWFPSSESKYKETIWDLRGYIDLLERGNANFFTRTDNLIPLLASFEDLLGSCDENLLKMYEPDGTKVSFFKADDYFFYTKGVLESMLTILEAVRIDYYKTLESRRSLEILDHALKALKHGEEINPWIVLNSNLGSIFANHRSNMAGPVSHARFHLGLLIKALST